MAIARPAAKTIRALSVCARLECLARRRVQTGVIRGVFPRGVYVMAEDYLVTIAFPESGNFPYGVLLPDEAAGQLGSLEPGAAVEVDPGRICIPSHDLTIDFSKATRWLPRPFEGVAVGPEALMSNLRALRRELLAAEGAGGGLADIARWITPVPRVDELGGLNPCCRKALPVLSVVASRWQFGLPDEAAAEARKLLGLGPGLTPSGDDFLLGMMAALWLGANIYPHLAHRLRRVIRYMGLSGPGVTTEVSSAFLKEAAAGFFPEKLLELAASLASTDQKRLAACARQLLQVGATSGGDMATGVLFGGYLLLNLMVLAGPERG